MSFTIFIIDDDPIDRFIAQKVIASVYETSSIESFGQAPSALAKLVQLAKEEIRAFPKLIFLDINMPLMNGFSFLDQLTSLPLFRIAHCEVIMLSSSIHDQDITKALEYRVVKTFLTKPITRELLENRVEKSLS